MRVLVVEDDAAVRTTIVTLLECDDAKRRWVFQTLAKALREYVSV